MDGGHRSSQSHFQNCITLYKSQETRATQLHETPARNQNAKLLFCDKRAIKSN